MKQPRKRGIKPENSKTVNQWGLRGRIPVDPLKPQYIWDNYYDVPQTIYYLEENTREMTEEEKADFRADRKVFGREGGKGEPKSAAKGGLKRKSPPLFPLAPGYGNMENLTGLPHSHTPPPPPFPLRLSLEKKNTFCYF